MLKKLISILIILMGAAVAYMGYNLGADADHGEDPDSLKYSATAYDVSFAMFGGDFYTEIHSASRQISKELNEIGSALEIVIKGENIIAETVDANIDATDSLIETVLQMNRSLMMTAGVMIGCIGLKSFADSFSSDGKKKKDKKPAKANVEPAVENA